MKDGGGEWERGEVDWRRKRREENKNVIYQLSFSSFDITSILPSSVLYVSTCLIYRAINL